MPRPPRLAPAGYCFHVLNRAIARAGIFDEPGDYLSFEAILREALKLFALELLAYCVMPNHWHLVVRPLEDDELSRFMAWLTRTHARRWLAFRELLGTGHVYQGRFRSIPVETETHFLLLCRYVERNPVRARLVARAEDWPYGSLAWRERMPAGPPWLASQWPVERPDDWLEIVNEPLTDAELKEIRESIRKGTPLGSLAWKRRVSEKLALGSTMRCGGRPRRR